MKKILCVVTIVASAAVIVLQSTEIKRQSRLIEAYDAYYKSAECLLDTLDYYDDWVDRFDPENYYESKSELNKLNK